MRLQETVLTGQTLVSTPEEQATVADLMTWSEAPVADPPLYTGPSAVGLLLLLLLLSPPEPADSPSRSR